MSRQRAVEWLLEDSQPAIRRLTLTQLLDRRENDFEVVKAQAALTKRGWAAVILRNQNPAGWWYYEESLYRPKYITTNWNLLVLADLGLTRREPGVRRACELWIRRFSKPDGGFGSERTENGHLCTTGNTTRALIQFGYVDHPGVKSALDWLVREQKEDGGWHCFGGKSGVLDSWEGLSAFAAYPRQRWTRGMKRAVHRGAEFYLERNLYREGARYPPWFRFHYPVHYFYDLLVGLEMVTALGYGDDRRLAKALDLLREKRRPDWRWNLDGVNPDLEGSYANWYRPGRKPAPGGYNEKPPIPFALERVGRPSKMITFRALRVLKRTES